MFQKFLSEKKGDVVQYIIVLAVIVVIIVFAFPKIKTSATCAVEKTYISIAKLIFTSNESVQNTKCITNSEISGKEADGTKKTEADKEPSSPSDNKEDEREEGESSASKGEDALTEAEKAAMPISHIDKGGLDLTCNDFYTYSDFTIPSSAPPLSIGTNAVKITNNKGWDMWVKVSSVVTSNQLTITSDHSYYRKISDGKTEAFDIGWKWHAKNATENKGQGKVYFQVVCKEPASNLLYLYPEKAPEKFTVTKTDDHSISFKWNSVPTTSEYFIYRGDVMVYRGTSTTYTDTELLPGTNYSYRLYTAESHKKGIFQSLQQKTTGTSPIPKAPTNLKVVDKSANSFYIVWSPDSKATHHHLYLNGKKIGTTVWGGYITGGQQPGANITFGVSSENMYGISEITNYTFQMNNLTSLANPNNFRQVSRTDKSQVIAWDAVPGATGYIVKHYGNTVYSGSNTSFEHKSLPAGNSIHYYLYTVKGNEISSGVQKSFTTSGVYVPTVPNTITISNITNTSLSLKWTKGSGARDTVVTMNGKEIYKDTGTSMSVTGLTPNTNYVFGLKSVNEGGASRVTTVEAFTTNDTYDQVSDLTASCQINEYNQSFTMPSTIQSKESGVFALNITNNSNKDIAFKVSEVSEKGSLFESKLATIEYNSDAILIKPTEVFTVPFRWFTSSSKASDYNDKSGSIDVKVQATC